MKACDRVQQTIMLQRKVQGIGGRAQVTKSRNARKTKGQRGQATVKWHLKKILTSNNSFVAAILFRCYVGKFFVG